MVRRHESEFWDTQSNIFYGKTRREAARDLIAGSLALAALTIGLKACENEPRYDSEPTPAVTDFEELSQALTD